MLPISFQHVVDRLYTRAMRPVPPAPAAGTPSIGPKLRTTRLAQGLTIAQVAEATGLTKGFISRIERDETSPSVATLVTICQVLSLAIGSLFEADDHEVIALEDAPLVNFGGSRVTERLLTPRAESRVQVLRSVLEPGASGGADYYSISCEAEVLHVLAGAITLRFPHEEITLYAGDSVTIAGREPHTWVHGSPDPAEVMWVITPAAWSGSA